jgi:hypothetical protein
VSANQKACAGLALNCGALHLTGGDQRLAARGLGDCADRVAGRSARVATRTTTPSQRR